MKGKGNGLEAIKGLALRHGEKLVMLLVVACAGWLVKSTLSHESLPPEKGPDPLRAKATQVRSKVDSFTWAEAQERAPEEVRIHETLRSGGSLEIPAEPYVISSSGFDPGIVPKLELRKDPKLLAVTRFEGHGVTNLFAFLDENESERRARDQLLSEAEREREREEEAERAAEEAERGGRRGRGGFDDSFGDGLIDGRRPVAVALPRAGVEIQGTELIRRLSCAVVMAQVPLPEQLQEFKNALANTRSYNPANDYPQYLGYYVQRAEVTGEGELEWKPLKFPNGHYKIEGDRSRSLPAITNLKDMIVRMTGNWPAGLEDVYDPRYGHEVLTVPQAPMVGRNWDDMAYMSDVPLASDMEDEMLDVHPDGDDLPEDDDDSLDITGDMFSAAGQAGGGGRFNGEFSGRPSGGASRRPTRGSVGGGEEFGGRGGGMSRAGMGAQFDEMTGELQVDVPFLMLRFFDLTVQPGKRYKYRVQLIMKDPNFRQARDTLEPEVANRQPKPAIYGEWSEASVTISIPQAGVIRVAESSRRRGGFNSEPEATMLVESFGIDEGGDAMQVYKEVPARRGAVMNFKGTVEMLVEQGRYIQEVDDFTIDTGVVVLDIDGGDSYTREMQEPTHALLMDASGRMYLRDELDDEIPVAIHRAVFAETEPGGGGGGFRGGGGGEFGGGFGFD